MNGISRTLIPLCAIYIRTDRGEIYNTYCYTIAQRVRIKETMRGFKVLSEADTQTVIAIQQRLETLFGYGGRNLEYHVIGFLEFKYNELIDDAWETYTSNLRPDPLCITGHGL